MTVLSPPHCCCWIELTELLLLLLGMSRYFPGLKAAVLGAINELYNEVSVYSVSLLLCIVGVSSVKGIL